MAWRIDLGNGLWYDNTPDAAGFDAGDIGKIEKHYNCRYVCEWNTVTKQNKIAESVIALFYQEVPHPQGSNWMGMFLGPDLGKDLRPYVMDGISASRLPIQGYVSNDGQVLFSKHRHDFRQSNDGSVTVDGGREYTRLLGNVRCKSVYLLPQVGQIAIIDESAANLLLSDLDKKLMT